MITTNPTLLKMQKERDDAVDLLRTAVRLLTKANDGGYELQKQNTALIAMQEELEQRRKDAVLDGKWLDSWGACRVCGGEIPDGHTNNCDLYKMEQELTTLKAKVAELEKDKERLDKLNTIPVGNALAHYPSGMWGIVSKDIPLSATAKLGATSVRDLIDAVEVTAIQNTRQKESGE